MPDCPIAKLSRAKGERAFRVATVRSIGTSRHTGPCTGQEAQRHPRGHGLGPEARKRSLCRFTPLRFQLRTISDMKTIYGMRLAAAVAVPLHSGHRSLKKPATALTWLTR